MATATPTHAPHCDLTAGSKALEFTRGALVLPCPAHDDILDDPYPRLYIHEVVKAASVTFGVE